MTLPTTSNRGDTVSVTVGDVRRWLEGFDDDAPVVVGAGIGYEHPKVALTNVRPVLVPGRFLYDKDGETAVVLRPTHG